MVRDLLKLSCVNEHFLDDYLTNPKRFIMELRMACLEKVIPNTQFPVRNGDKIHGFLKFQEEFNPMVESGFQGDWKPTAWMSTNPGLIWIFPKK